MDNTLENIGILDFSNMDLAVAYLTLIHAGAQIISYVHYESPKDYIVIDGVSNIAEGKVMKSEELTTVSGMEKFINNYMTSNISGPNDRRTIHINIYTKNTFHDYFSKDPRKKA